MTKSYQCQDLTVAMPETDSSIMTAMNSSTSSSSSGSHLLATSSYGSSSKLSDLIQLSRRRWAILIAICFIGTTNYMADDVNAILHTMLIVLDLPISTFVYITNFLIFLNLIAALPIGWFMDKYGIKNTMYLNIVLILIRNSTKALLFNPDLPNWEKLRYFYWTVTSISGSGATTLFFCLPFKISETWFSASERSFAWTMMTSSAYIGFIINSAVLPNIIQTIKDVKYLFYLNIVLGILVTITILLCVTQSKPDHPPSERMIKSNSQPIAYSKSFKTMLTNRDIMLNLLFYASNDGFNLAIITVLQDVLTSVGHGEAFGGLVMAITSVFSLIVMNALSITVHRVRNILRICRIGCLLSSTTFFLYLITLLYPLPDWIVLTFAVINRTIIAWANPNFTNMAAHLASGIVSEAIVAGFAGFISIAAMGLTRLIFVAFAEPMNGKLDYTYSILSLALINLVLALAYILYFGGKFSTMEQK